MKNFPGTIRLICFSLALGGCLYGVQAQGSPLLGKFSLSQFDGHVSLYWQIVEGSTCNGIQIYRSTDSVDFDRIGYIAGICGSEFESMNYYFTDSLPVENSVNYYYLELGTIGVSDVISIDVISSGNSGYQIRPHPVVDQATIYFNALDASSHVLRVYDMQGKEVFNDESADNFFDITTTSLPSGSYVFTISSSEKSTLINGVFLVQY